MPEFDATPPFTMTGASREAPPPCYLTFTGLLDASLRGIILGNSSGRPMFQV